MESRKDQLQKQIIEALKADDSDLYSLLKSQWAHRFGVESLEELKELESKQSRQNPTNLINQKPALFDVNSIEVDRAINIEDDENKEKYLKTKDLGLTENENIETFKIKSYEKVDKENKAINTVRDYKNHSDIKALIPLPPKPKYSYLRKWLLRR